MARYYSNTSKLMQLTGSMDTSVTTANVDDASGLPVSFPYFIAVDADTSSVEIMSVTGAAGNVLTVVRGQQDTAAKTHSIGAHAYHAWTAVDGSDAQAHYAATSAVHGVVGAVVGTTDAQVLTNKTISGASNTLSAIPGSALTGSITTATIAVANVTGDWPIDTRSTGSIPIDTRTTGNLPIDTRSTGSIAIDTRTTGNLPGSRVASPITAVMAFSAAVTMASTLGVTGALSVTGAVTGSSTFKGTDFIVAGSPDRNVKTELNDVLIERSNEQLADAPTTTSTSYTQIGTACGTAFVAPSTGKVRFDFFAEMKVTTLGDSGLVSIEVREGAVVGSGTVVLNPQGDGQLVQNQTTGLVTTSCFHTISGLTPGADYNVRLLCRVSAGTLTLSRRGVSVRAGR